MKKVFLGFVFTVFFNSVFAQIQSTLFEAIYYKTITPCNCTGRAQQLISNGNFELNQNISLPYNENRIANATGWNGVYVDGNVTTGDISREANGNDMGTLWIHSGNGNRPQFREGIQNTLRNQIQRGRKYCLSLDFKRNTKGGNPWGRNVVGIYGKLNGSNPNSIQTAQGYPFYNNDVILLARVDITNLSTTFQNYNFNVFTNNIPTGRTVDRVFITYDNENTGGIFIDVDNLSICEIPSSIVDYSNICKNRQSVAQSGNGIFYSVNNQNKVVRTHFSNNWQQQSTLIHWGAQKVYSGSLLSLEEANNLVCVNTNGSLSFIFNDQGSNQMVAGENEDTRGLNIIPGSLRYSKTDQTTFGLCRPDGIAGPIQLFFAKWVANNWRFGIVPRYGADINFGSFELLNENKDTPVYINANSKMCVSWGAPDGILLYGTNKRFAMSIVEETNSLIP